MEIYNKQDNNESALETSEEAPSASVAASETEETTDSLPMASQVGRRGSNPWPARRAKDTEKATTGKSRSGLGRGGAGAIALVLVFIPLVIILFYLLMDANTKIDGFKTNIRAFNGMANSSNEADFAVLLSEPNLQIYPFKADDLAPVGKVVLYSAGRLRWGFSYGKLEALPNGQMYVMWLLRKATSNREQGYERLALMPDVRTGGRVFVLKDSDFPPSFLVDNYAELVVTIEPVDQTIVAPTGPRRFSLDLSKVNG
jgi:hypothetical protein